MLEKNSHRKNMHCDTRALTPSIWHFLHTLL